MFPEVLYELFRDMPRQGPGSNECTRKAFKRLSHLPKQPHILDIGCGSGMQTPELAKWLTVLYCPKLSGGMISINLINPGLIR